MSSAIAYIVRPGDDNEELRYSLRSVWWNMPHTEVWIVGHCPGWVRGVRTIPVEQSTRPGMKRPNALANLAMLAAGGPDEFVLFNDDFFVVRPAEWPPRPAHRGRLASLAADRRTALPLSPYAKVLELTDTILREAGFPDPLAYETHMPMHLTAEGLALALDYGDQHSGGEQFAPRSLYGNLLQIRGEQVGDVKVRDASPAPAWQCEFVSTTDASFRYHPIGKRLRELFPEASPYER